MLQQLSQQVRQCYERAAEAKQKAGATGDRVFKADLVDMEKHWLVLARSYAFTESLGDFTAAMSDWRRKHDRTEDRTPSPGSLFDVLPVALFVCDRNGLILQYN